MWLELFNQMRKNAKMSLDELSAASGVPKGTLAKISSGITRNPSIETMLTLVHTLGYRLGDLDEDGTQVVSAREMEQLKKYRVLDVQGQKLVNTVLQLEYDRMTFVTDREQKVLRLRFGLDDGRARTLEEVGKVFNVTRERIRQIEAKALRKLRHPSRSRKLKDYLD